MTYHSVLEYIRAGRACGLDDDDIGKRLSQGGWLDIDIRDAFALVAKMDKAHEVKSAEVCPPDRAEQPPTPKIGNHLLAQKTPHMSAMRFTMWLVILLVTFYAGFTLMS